MPDVRGSASRQRKGPRIQAARGDSAAAQALARLEALGSARIRDEYGPRYGIHTDKAFGVSIANIQAMAKDLGRDHDLAAALWATGWYEARLLASFVDEPARVTRAQMDRWCRDFDNWGICDTVCFKLFDRVTHAWACVEAWADRRNEFEKRAAFALLASLALHDKGAGDQVFVDAMPLVERAASDDRNFVKKGVSWALRSIGRRNATLHAAAMDLARTLAAATEPAPHWVGKDALKDIAKLTIARTSSSLGRADKPPRTTQRNKVR